MEAKYICKFSMQVEQLILKSTEATSLGLLQHNQSFMIRSVF